MCKYYLNSMKKILIFILLLTIVACSKKKPILGERKDIFVASSNIEITGNLKNIKIEKAKTLDNYYGDSSILNKGIENYNINSMSFVEEGVSKKKFGIDHYYFSNPAVVDGVVYYLDMRGFLNAKNLKDDKVLWKVKIVTGGDIKDYYVGKLSFYNDNIYMTVGMNEIISVTKDGLINWRKKFNTIPNSVPVIENDNIFIITQDNKLYCIDTADGRIKWIHYGTVKDSGILGSANPVIYKNYVISAYSSGELFVVNKHTGESVFSTNLVGRYSIFSNFELTDIDSTPIIKNDILIATANNGVTIAINLNNFKEVWRQNLPSLTNVVVNGNFIYMMTTDNIVLCLNLSDGKINWFKKLDKYKNMNKKDGVIYYKSLIFINGNLYTFNNIGQYKAINPLDGNIVEEKELPFVLIGIPVSIQNNFFGFGISGRYLNIVKSNS